MAEVAARRRMRRAPLLFVARAGLAVSLLAAPPSRADDAKAPWQPKAPDGVPADFDWIRLPSDEWLKGKIVSMYDGKLEFDSDELGVHTFDFADIKELRSSRVVQVGLADRPPLTGRLVVDDSAARILGEAGETAFARSDSLTIVNGAKKEIDYWSGYANWAAPSAAATATRSTTPRGWGRCVGRSGLAPGSNTLATSPASTPRTPPTITGSPSAGTASSPSASSSTSSASSGTATPSRTSLTDGR